MPIPHSRPSRRGVFSFVVFGLLLTSQLSFGYRGRSWLSPSNWQVSFGALQAGKTAMLPEVLTNRGHYPITISSAALAGSGFSVSSPTLPLVLSPGESVTLNITFAPSTSDDYSGTLSVAWGRYGRTLNISVAGTGNGSGPATVAPASLSFGSVAVGASSSKSATLKAPGEGTVISSVTTTNPEFTVSGLSLPLTLSPGQSVPFTVNFKPQSAGAASASLSFTSTAAGALASQSLTGTGSATPAPVAHRVSLTWQDGPDEVAGYNVYRGTTSGGQYTKVNSTLDNEHAYTDAAVEGGTNYFYVITAVAADGTESGYSSEVMAVVPAS